MTAGWVTACANGSCIQARAANGDVEIRVTSIVNGPNSLLATEGEWLRFVQGVKAGRFDGVVPQVPS